MHPRRILAIPLITCAVTLVATGVSWRDYSLGTPGELVVKFFDVGQGDSALLVTPTGKQILIDGGPDTSALRGLGKSMPFFDRSIDLLVLSHPDLDHIGAFPEVLRRYRVGGVLMTGIDEDKPRYREFLTLMQELDIPLLVADPGRDIDLGDGVVLDVLWPRETLFNTQVEDANEASVVLKVQYGSSSILFTGDMGEQEEAEVLASGADLSADILKIGHHGSRYSTSTGFLLAVDPKEAVISAGKDNTYGHPHPVILERLRHFGVPVRTTAEEGLIEIRVSH